MQKGHTLYFSCQHCGTEVDFSLFEIEDTPFECSHCHAKYRFNDPILKRQLNKFAALCKQLQDSEEILSETSVGVDVDGKQVQVPYKLLLTRLNPRLDLLVGNTKIAIQFRIEPQKDFLA